MTVPFCQMGETQRSNYHMKSHKVEMNVNLSPAGTNSGNIFDYIDIVEAILLKLPIKCVCRCKGVRKSWYDLIVGPGFSKNYAKTLSCTWLLSSSSYMGGSIDMDDGLYLLQTEGIDAVESCFNLKRVSKPDDLKVVGSCNGLCCLIKYHDPSDDNEPHLLKTVTVCNPLTRECVTLPTGEYNNMVGAHYGFGFSRSTRRYKVLRMGKVFDRLTRSVSTFGHIFTLGVDENWREIEDPSFICDKFNSAIYSNGGIHCVHHDSIYAFDVDEEKARWLPFPPSLWGILHTKLIELDGHFCVVHRINKFQIDIWVMKEYGVVELWTKSVISMEPQISSPIYMTPLTRLKEGRLLFRSECPNNLFAYDQKDDKKNVVSCNFVIVHFYAFIKLVTYVPCFASLKDVIAQGREDTSVNPNQNSS